MYIYIYIYNIIYNIIYIYIYIYSIHYTYMHLYIQKMTLNFIRTFKRTIYNTNHTQHTKTHFQASTFSIFRHSFESAFSAYSYCQTGNYFENCFRLFFFNCFQTEIDPLRCRHHSAGCGNECMDCLHTHRGC